MKEKTAGGGRDPAAHVKELLPHLEDSFIKVCVRVTLRLSSVCTPLFVARQLL